MKKIALILAIVCIGYMVQGQTDYKRLFEQADSAYAQAVQDDVSYRGLWVRTDHSIDGGRMITFKSRIVTLDLLEEYQEYCYNDSTNIKAHKETYGEWCISYDGHTCDNPEHYEYRWVHKEPTFNGFIEWLKLKEQKQ